MFRGGSPLIGNRDTTAKADRRDVATSVKHALLDDGEACDKLVVT